MIGDGAESGIVENSPSSPSRVKLKTFGSATDSECIGGGQGSFAASFEIETTTDAATTTNTNEQKCGWNLRTFRLVSMFFVISCSMGITIGQINYAFGVMVGYFSQEHPEWSRTEINLAYSIHQITASLVSPFSGKAVDKFGPRYVVSFALLWIGCCFGLLMFVNSLAQLYVLYSLMGMGYIAIIFLGPPKVIGRWTDPKIRGRVMGTVSVGNNLGGLVMTQVSTALGSLKACSIGFFIINIALTCTYFALVRNQPPKHNPESEKEESHQEDNAKEEQEEAKPNKRTMFRRLAKSPLFWMSTFCMVCVYWTYASVLSNILPALRAEGFEEQTAANIVSLLAIFGVISKILGGFLSDRFTVRRVLMLVLIIQAIPVILFGLITTDEAGVYWALFSLYGIGFGAVGALLPVFCMELFGLDDFGTIYGIQNMFFVIPSFVGPLVAGISYDSTGSYGNSFIAAGAVFLIGFTSLYFLPKLTTKTQN